MGEQHALRIAGRAGGVLDECRVFGVRARLERGLQELDRAFMGTIHAFCARLLRERPIEAGIDPGFLETTAPEANRLAARFWSLHLERLAASGHRADVPTVFVWEGVTMYLPRAASEATLVALASIAAKGSTLAVTYVEPELAHMPAVLRPAVLSVFAAVGEPVIGAMRPDEMGTLLAKHGFTPIEDTGSRDWSRRYGVHEPKRVLTRERLAVARS